MTTMACRSSLARFGGMPSSSRAFSAAHTYTHLAAARGVRNQWTGRSHLDLFNPTGLSYAYATSSSFAPIGNAPAAASSSKLSAQETVLRDRPPMVIPEESSSSSSAKNGPVLSPDAASPQVAARPPKPPKVEKPKPRLVGRKAALTLTPGAVQRLRALLSGPHPQLIRIGVRNKGCAGMSYHLEYVEKPSPFDEIVEQDGVRVLIDSKALFSIIGSEMDWVEDRLSAKFAFKNPNVKDACGCGESFSIGN